MVQQGAKSKDISDIISIGADDANDYMAATGTTEASSDETSEQSTEQSSNVFSESASEEKPKPKKSYKPEVERKEMTDDEIKAAMAKMTPRQRKALWHQNDVTDMPQHDDSTLEKTENGPYGFGINSLFNTHNSYRYGKDDVAGEDEPKPLKQWWMEEKYPV